MFILPGNQCQYFVTLFQAKSKKNLSILVFATYS